MPLKIASTTLAAAVLAAVAPAWAAGALDGYRWQSRVLVVSAPSADDAALRTQNRWLAADTAGLGERNLVVIRVVGDRVEASDGRRLEPKALRKATGLPADLLGVALIGKDGGEKFKASQPVSMTSLFDTIDAMPMRQDEMRKR